MLRPSSRPTSSSRDATTSTRPGGGLFRDNVPVGIYRQLVKDVNATCPLCTDLKLRQRMLALAELSYEDLYAPLVNEVDRTIRWRTR